MIQKTFLEKIDEKGSELIVNFIYMLFGIIAIICSYIFSSRREK